MRWILCRQKKATLVLRLTSHPTAYSYTRIPLTHEQADKTLEFSKHWVPVTLGTEYELVREDDPVTFDKLEKRFLEVVEEHKDELQVVPNKKVKMVPEGTSKLVRNTNKSAIHVARRRKGDVTTINVVCIDDNHRDMFFRDSRNCHGRPADGGMYFIADSDGLVFEQWSNYMDNAYETQAKNEAYNKLKTLNNI